MRQALGLTGVVFLLARWHLPQSLVRYAASFTILSTAPFPARK